MADDQPKNVFGAALEQCCTKPKTGFYRDGFCRTGPNDSGVHVVAAKVTKEFLDFTKSRGNELETPRPEYDFPGLKPGDNWCLCALRWKEAEKASKAPPVNLNATDKKALDYISIENLKKYSMAPPEQNKKKD